ncbi:MAG: hypothetical protein ACLGGX_09445 [Bdellovibrionia bacterium]
MIKSKILLLIALSISLSNCIKKPELEDDHGPVVEPAAIQSALVEAWGDADPTSIKTNEFTYIEKDQAIEDLPAKLVGQEGITVARKEELSDEFRFTLIRQINEIIDGQSKLSTREEVIRVPKLNAQASVGTQSLGVSILQNLLMACIPGEDWNVTCHNLQVKSEVKPAPDLVKRQENCGGIPECKMTYKTVSFDLVVKTSNDPNAKAEKVNYRVEISPEAPYLSKLMTFCYRGVVTVSPSQNQYLVTLCNRVMNFQFGQ